MPNPWLEHVKKWAAENGHSYGCSLTMKECKDSYNKIDYKARKIQKKEEEEKLGKMMFHNTVATYVERLKAAKEHEIPALRSSIKMKSDKFKQYFIKNWPKTWDRYMNN